MSSHGKIVQRSKFSVTRIANHVPMKRSKKRKLMSYCMKHISGTWTNALPQNGNVALPQCGNVAMAPLFAKETATGPRLIV